MANDSLSLLWELKVGNTDAKAKLAETRAAVAGLRTSFGSDLAVMEKVGTQALRAVSQEATILIRSVPLVGGSFAQAAGGISTFTSVVKASAAATSAITALQTEAATATVALTAAQEAAAVAQSAVNAAKEAYLPLTGLATAGTTTEAAAKAVLAAAEEAAAIATTELAAAEQAATVTATELAVATTAVDASLAPILITVGALVVAIGGVALLLGGAAVAAFKLAESASDAGSKIHDLAQQTNLTALTLSGIKVAADQSSKSIDTLVPAMGRLNRIALSAVEGNKAAIASLKQFGLTGQEVQANTDAALGKIILRLHELVPSGQAAGAATKLFGRAGAELIPIVEQMNGNLAEAIQKAKDLGQAFDDEGARAADEFGDHLSDLKKTVEGLAYSVGNALIPSFNEFFRVLSAESRHSIFGDFLNGLKVKLFEIKSEAYVAIAAFETLFSIGAGTQLGTIIDTFKANLARIVTEAYTVPPDKGKAGPPLDTSDGKSGANAARKKAAEEYRVALKAAADAEKDLQIANQTNTRNNKEELDNQTLDLDEFTKNAKRYNDDLRQATEARIDAETIATNVAFQKKILSQAQYNEKQKELLTQRKEEEEKFNAADQALEDARLKGNAQAAQANRDRVYASQVAADNRLLAEDKRLADEGYILFAEAEARREQIEKDAHERTKANLEEEFRDSETSAERRRVITQALADLDNDYQNQVRDNIDKTAKARQKDLEQEQKDADELYRIQHELLDRMAEERRNAQLKDPTSNRSLFGDDFQNALDMGMSKLGAFSEMAGGIFHELSASAGNFGTMMYDVFQGIGQAVGNAVKSFVLLGNSGTSVRKFAAEVIASVAQMAIVKAVFELAEGFAALARAFFGDPKAAAEATLHFHAAAIYGGIGAIAAIAGRGIAGNSFKSDAGGGGGGGASSTGSRGASTSQDQTRTIEQGRNQLQERVIVLRVESNDSHIVNVIQKDAKNNGPTRDLIIQLAGT